MRDWRADRVDRRIGAHRAEWRVLALYRQRVFRMQAKQTVRSGVRTRRATRQRHCRADARSARRRGAPEHRSVAQLVYQHNNL